MMQSDRHRSLAIFVFIIIGTVGLPVGIYQWIERSRSGWVCYSKHGHVLESVTGCKFNLFSGILVSAAALTVGLFQAWKRR